MITDVSKMRLYNEYNNYLPSLPAFSGKGVICSDIHVPHTDYNSIETILNLPEEYTFAVIVGDIFDADGFSKFPKKKITYFPTEYTEVVNQIFKPFSERFEEVFVIKGNHDMRMERYFGRTNQFAMAGFMMNPDPLFHACQGFDIVKTNAYEEKMKPIHDFSNIYYFNSTELELGDAIFSHHSNFRTKASSTAQGRVEAFIPFNRTFNYLFTGHTHRIADVMHMGRRAIETGCLCKNYLPAEKSKFLTEQCYIGVEYKDGHILPNSVDIVRIGR